MSMLYRMLSLVVSLLGGMVAVKLFNRLWTRTRGEEHAPDARDLDRGWREVLLAAGAQGAVYGLVKAATRRLAAQGAHKDLVRHSHTAGRTTGTTRTEAAVRRTRERVPVGRKGR